MANIRKRPTETITTRVPKTYIKFFKTLKNRNEYILQLIQNSKEFKEYMQNLEVKDNSKSIGLFKHLTSFFSSQKPTL